MRHLLLLALAATLSAPVHAATPLRKSHRVPAEAAITQLIVKLRPEKGAGSPDARVQALGRSTGQSMRLQRAMSGEATVTRLERPVSAAEARRLAQQLALQPGVEYAVPDYRRHPTFTPDDSSFAAQWHLMAPAGTSGSQTTIGGMNATAAWDISTGVNATVVAVLDTGVLPHPDFGTRLLPGYDFVSNTVIANDGNGRDSNASDPGNWVSAADTSLAVCDGEEVADSDWHGTHVAGLVAAQGNNTAFIAGANWGTRILPVRVLGKCGGFDSDIIDAIRWSAGLTVSGVPANPTPADVINLSLGANTSCTAAYQNVFNQVHAAGVTVVASTGNDGAYSVLSPANCDHVIAVTSHAVNGTSSIFANVGPETALSAPGGGPGTNASGVASGSDLPIPSLGNSGTTTPTSTWTVLDYVGTSQSAPLVSGTVALVRGLLPDATPDQIRTLLTDNVRAFPSGSWCTLSGRPQSDGCGAGLLDTGKVLLAAALLDTGNNAPVITALTTRSGKAGQALTFSLGATDADGDPLTFITVTLPPGATLDAGGRFRWDEPVAGSYTIAFEVSDGTVITGPGTVTLTIAAATSSLAAPTGGSGGGALPVPLLALLGLLALATRRPR